MIGRNLMTLKRIDGVISNSKVFGALEPELWFVKQGTVFLTHGVTTLLKYFARGKHAVIRKKGCQS